MPRAPLCALLGLLLAADGLLGCNLSCEKETERKPEDFGGGQLSVDCKEYQSAAFDKPYKWFPAGRRLRFAHGLGVVPSEVKSYVAFVREPLDAAVGNTAESAGNQVIIEKVDDQYVQVHNDTCEEFFLRLVVRAADGQCAGAPAAAGAGGATNP